MSKYNKAKHSDNELLLNCISKKQFMYLAMNYNKQIFQGKDPKEVIYRNLSDFLYFNSFTLIKDDRFLELFKDHIRWEEMIIYNYANYSIRIKELIEKYFDYIDFMGILKEYSIENLKKRFSISVNAYYSASSYSYAIEEIFSVRFIKRHYDTFNNFEFWDTLSKVRISWGVIEEFYLDKDYIDLTTGIAFKVKDKRFYDAITDQPAYFNNYLALLAI